MAEYKSIYTGEQIDTGIGKALTSLQQETDPIFSNSPSANITNEDITNWNGKTSFSGSYNDLTDKPDLFSGDYDDLTNKPDIPSATSDLTNDSGFINKNVNDLTNYTKTSDLPTDLSDFNNDSGFITNSVNNLVNYYLKSETYTKDEVTALIGAIQQFHYEIVQELPQTGANNIMYLVPKSTSQTNNYYDEYVYSNGWEKIGDTEIDLSNYVQNTDYATGNTSGVIKASENYGLSMQSNGQMYATNSNYSTYQNASQGYFIGKGTLENVLNNRFADYTTTANLTTLLAGKQNVIDSTHKLDADLVDDTNSTNKFFSGDYNDLSNKPVIPSPIQYATMPTASAETVGKIVQYVGTTDSTYTNGYFYIGTSDGQDPATYSWENLQVQGTQLPSDMKVFYIENNSSSNPFVFSEHETGIYYFNSKGAISDGSKTLYFKTFPNGNIKNQSLPVGFPLYYVSDVNNYETTPNIAYMYTSQLFNNEIYKTDWRFSVMNQLGLGIYNTQKICNACTLDTEQTITSKKTFSVLPQSSVTPTTANQLVNKAYVDGLVDDINTVLATLTTPSGNGGNE